ncbi:MAG: hypothetical protein ACE5J4_02300 [Candidatus Aenigmatarchaeota archaeon]
MSEIKPELWLKIGFRVPSEFKEACDIAMDLTKTLDKLSIGLEKEIFLRSDFIKVKQLSKRLMTFILNIPRREEVDEDKLEELEKNLENLVKILAEREKDKVISDLERRTGTSALFYIGDIYEFLGIFYDTLNETIIATESDFKKNFSEIILRRIGIYPELPIVSIERKRGE